MKFLLFLLSIPLVAQPLLIDSGSDADQYFTGGSPFAVQPASDPTLRFGTFSYKIPATNNVPYTIKLNFMEPSAVPPARVFSVSINDQVVVSRMSMLAALTPFSRSFIAIPFEGAIEIKFVTIIRSAVVSSIEIAPFGLSTPTVRTEQITGALATWEDGGYFVPRAVAPSDPAVVLNYRNVAVYRNGLRLQTLEYTTTPSPVSRLKIVPEGGQPWPVTDTVLVDYLLSW